MIMKKVELPMVPFRTCEESLRKTRLGGRFNLHNSFVCAGGQENVDTCQVCLTFGLREGNLKDLLKTYHL